MTPEIKPDQVQFTTRPFGRYYLIDKLAVGGMAEVFKAVFLGLHDFEMQLVIKRILPNLSANEEFVAMFVKEAKIYVELRHHNIVQIYDFAKFHEHYFIAMEHVNGKDLKQLLLRLAEQQRTLPTEMVLFIAHEICKGLDYAHNKPSRGGENLGVVHRDLTPANIVLSYAGEVKIADFGIAKAKISANITKAGALKGKYEYMSPEQARGEQVDSRSDIFAVGILLHEMLTGRRLFKTESDTATLEKVKSVDIEEPIAINPRVSPRLNQIVMRCLHPSKEARFQSAKSLQQALQNSLYPTPLAFVEEQLSKTLSDLFAKDRQRETQRENRNKEKAQALKAELDNLPDDDIELIDDIFPEAEPLSTSSNSFSSQDKKILWIFAITILVLLGIIVRLNTAPQNEVIVSRLAATKLLISVFPQDADGVLSVGGNKIGTGASFRIENLSAQQDLELQYKSSSHALWTQKINVQSNETTQVFIQLQDKK